MRAARVATWLGPAAFLVFSTAAMAVYPGRYAFFHSVYSALGHLWADDGADNALASMLFRVAVSAVGIAQIVATPWFAVPGRRAAAAASILVGAGQIGIANTPADVMLEPHILAVRVWLFALVFYAGLVATFAPSPWRALYALAAAGTLAYALALELGALGPYGAVIQKVVVFGYLATLLATPAVAPEATPAR